mgnify:CR=1 FL=1|jgi:hypothetical protein
MSELEERKIITLGEKAYFLDSIDEKAKNRIMDIELIRKEVERLKTSAEIANIALTSFNAALVIELESAEEA